MTEQTVTPTNTSAEPAAPPPPPEESILDRQRKRREREQQRDLEAKRRCEEEQRARSRRHELPAAFARLRNSGWWHGQPKDAATLDATAGEKARAWIAVVALLDELGLFERLVDDVRNDASSFDAPELADETEREQEANDRRDFLLELLQVGASRDEPGVVRLLREGQEHGCRGFRDCIGSWINHRLEEVASRQFKAPGPGAGPTAEATQSVVTQTAGEGGEPDTPASTPPVEAQQRQPDERGAVPVVTDSEDGLPDGEKTPDVSQLARYKKGPAARRQRTLKRNQLIDQAKSAGITDPDKIFAFVREQDMSLVLSSKREITPKSMMKVYERSRKAGDNCNLPG